MAIETRAMLGEETPDLGAEVIVKVVPSQTRTSYFPDQAAVFGRGGGFLEIILLRQEVSLGSQIGTVRARSEDGLSIDFKPHQVSAEMVDVAHLRMAVEPAIDMAMGVLALALGTGAANLDQVMNRLQTSDVEST